MATTMAVNPLRQARVAQFQALLEGSPDSVLWAERTMCHAKRAVRMLGDEVFDAVLAEFSDAWFEARTWRAQAEAFGRLLARWERRPAATVPELAAAFAGRAQPQWTH